MEQLVIENLLYQWDNTISRMNDIFDDMAPWAFDKAVAPGRNKMSYLIGHLVVSQDKMIEAMELGQRFFEDLDSLYTVPQNTATVYLPYAELREKWLFVNPFLKQQLGRMTADDWLRKHHYVSEADFAREPHRNRLAIFVTRYNHLYTHLGQLRLIKREEFIL